MKSKQKINTKKLLMVTIFTATLFSNSASSALANTITISQQAQKLAQTVQKQIPSADQIKDFHPLIFMDGKQVTFKNPIKNYADSTYLPFREVGSLIGASAQWSNEYRVAKFTKDNTTVEIINQTSASVVSKINARKILMVAIFTATLFSNSASSVLANTITISQQAQKLAQTAQKQIPSADKIVDFHPLIFMDGKQVTFKNPIKNYAGSTYLPFREVGSLIGASAQWSNEYRVAKFTKDNTTVEIINQTSASVVSNNNGRDNKVKEVTISNGKQSIPALNINGTTYVPLRYLSETFGMDIRYHNPHKQTNQKTITINEHDNLDYKQQKPQQQGVHPVNVGKLPTAPDGIDYNAKYLEYFEGNNKNHNNKAYTLLMLVNSLLLLTV